MLPSHVFIWSFLIGVVCGLRSLTAPAVVCWAAHWGWIDLHGSRLSFLGSTAALIVFSVLAVGELVADKLPRTPPRTATPGLSARLLLGALSGTALALAGGQSALIGGFVGAAGGVLGAYGGYQVRTRLVRSSGLPDYVIALLEDAVAIGGAFLIVAQF